MCTIYGFIEGVYILLFTMLGWVNGKTAGKTEKSPSNLKILKKGDERQMKNWNLKSIFNNDSLVIVRH